MTMNPQSDSNRASGSVEQSIRNNWFLFVGEGAVLVLLGFLAVIVPSIASSQVTVALGWLFLPVARPG